MKSFLGLALAFAIGFACRAFGIPSPAPPVIVGALLVVAMTIGYLLVARFATQPARHAIDCGGPSGLTPSATRGTTTPPNHPISYRTGLLDRAQLAVYPAPTPSALRLL